MKEPNIRTRREFLKSSLIGSALTWTLPGFLHSTMVSLHAESTNSLVQSPTGKDDSILVVLQLAGGNDGLNTIIPVTNDFYYKARPALAVPAKGALKMDDHFGMHPSLGGLKSVWDEGQLAIVHGIGYPNPNRSHFRSMEIWQTASDSKQVEKHGWIGRYFDNQCGGCPAEVAISISNQAPQAFSAAVPKGITFQTPENYRFDAPAGGEMMASQPEPGVEDDADEEANAGSSVSAIAGSSHAPNLSPIDFLERTSLDAQVSSEKVNEIVKKTRTSGSYPKTRLGGEFQLVSRLIAGGMNTRIYYLSHGGFDTHSSQKGAHDRLLREFSDALKAFIDDLSAQGNLGRVTILTFSEFGRRVKENGSGGTDHGAAAPLFIAGGSIKPGHYGKVPSLDPKDLDQGDLKFTTDFRSVYATLLEKKLNATSKKILGRKFPLLEFV